MGVSESVIEVNETAEAMKKSFGMNMLKAMRRSGIMQKKLSEKTGISSMQIYKYMSGSLLPDVKTLEKIAKALGVTVNDLVSNQPAEVKTAECAAETEAAAVNNGGEDVLQNEKDGAEGEEGSVINAEAEPEKKTVYVSIDSDAIRRLCKEKGITQAYVGKCLCGKDAPKGTIYNILYSGRASEDFVNSLARLLGVPAEDLILSEGSEKKAHSSKTHCSMHLDKDAVKSFCKKRGLTLGSLAKKAGIPLATINNYLYLGIGVPEERLKAIASALGVSTDDITDKSSFAKMRRFSHLDKSAFSYLDKRAVKEACKSRGITFKTAADEAGIPYNTLKGYLAGRFGVSNERLKNLAEVLGVRPDEIILGESSSVDTAFKSGKADDKAEDTFEVTEPEPLPSKDGKDNSEKEDDDMPAKNQPGGETDAASKRAEYVDLCISNEVKSADTLVSMLMRSPKRDIDGVMFVAENVSYFDGVCDAVSAMCGGHA